MNIHKNAALTPKSRGEVARHIAEGHSKAEVAKTFGICARTASKWVKRFRDGCAEALADRSSRPRRLRRKTPADVTEHVIAPRRQRLPGKEIALRTGLSAATVSRILRAEKLSRAKGLAPPPPPNRHEHAKPGAMIHIDIKKLGRYSGIGHRIMGDRTTAVRTIGKGWEFVHVAIDDNSRVAFSKISARTRQLPSSKTSAPTTSRLASGSSV